MDVGPQNVLGKRPTLVDPLVQLLLSKIENFVGKSDDMEFEGRIGLICTPLEKRKGSGGGGGGGGTAVRERLLLPVLSETVIATDSTTSSNGKSLRHEFDPNLDKSTFEKIKQRMDLLCSGQTPPTAPPNPLFKVIGCTSSHTVDEVYKKPYSARLSYAWASYAQEGVEPVEIICKENIEKIDVWSGYFGDMDEEGVIEDEGRSRHPFDYRLAVNSEKKLPTKIFGEFAKSDCVLKREKKRTSYEMKAWVVDLTHVSVIGNSSSGSEPSDRYEVEVELKADLLLDQLDRRAKGKPHGAYQILNDFLYFLRDLCFVFGVVGENENQDLKRRKGVYPEMASCEPSDDKKRKYVQTTGYQVFPIIGDYIYQIADQVRPS